MSHFALGKEQDPFFFLHLQLFIWLFEQNSNKKVETGNRDQLKEVISRDKQDYKMWGNQMAR